MKKCSKCGVVKPLEEFNKKKRSKDGRREQCRICQRSEGKKYYRQNKEKVCKRTAKYYRDNKEKYAEYSREWCRKNPERSRARYLKYKHSNLEACRQRDEEYRLNNLDRDAAKTAARRASKRQRTPKWLTEQHFLGIASFYEEALRLEKETGIKHHVDHVIPLNGETVSGLHVPWNLQVIPAQENILKSNKFEG